MNIREMSSEVAAKLWEDIINRWISELIHSHNTDEAFGGLLAIGVFDPRELSSKVLDMA